MSREACLKAKVFITNFGGIGCTAYTACGRKILARITCAFLSYNALFSIWFRRFRFATSLVWLVRDWIQLVHQTNYSPFRSYTTLPVFMLFSSCIEYMEVVSLICVVKHKEDVIIAGISTSYAALFRRDLRQVCTDFEPWRLCSA